jgi:VCBS repeat-containing protein
MAITISSSVTTTLPSNADNLILTGTADINGTGNGLNNTITGNAGSNILSGGSGADTLVGDAGNDLLDGGVGADVMQGGPGNDTYVVERGGDIVIENPGDGTDLVQASISYTLTDNVEDLTLTGSALNGTGNALANVIQGNGGDNVLSGNDGNDTLIGNTGNDTLDGGAGADTMQGGTGNDTYVVDNLGDVVIETPNGYTDTVLSSVDYMLTAYVENLTLTGTDNLNGIGNALKNGLTGNSGDNLLDGGLGDDSLYGAAGDDHLLGGDGNDLLDGGTGADTMEGGLGNDTYVVDDARDLVVEASNAGVDMVQSSIAYTLAVTVENLTLTGTAAIDGTGSEFDNILNGNPGDNVLDGRGGNDTIHSDAGNDTLFGGDGNDLLDGGAGADVMHGGTGDDTYVVDEAGDQVIENAGEGYDTVQAGISYALGDTVESVLLTGSANIDATGNALNNRIYGNFSNNLLSGMDGNDNLAGYAGDDTLDGGAGNDFLFGGDGNDHLLGGAGDDFITGEMGGNTIEGGDDTLFGGDGNDTLYGNWGSDQLNGDAGDDQLYGGIGADVMRGGTGDDTYAIDDAVDVIIENTGEGKDSVQSYVSYTLAANVENLALQDSANFDGTGNELDNVITGNRGNNVLNGGEGNDTLTSGAGNDTLVGGSGADTLQGGLGDDSYRFHAGDGADRIIDSEGSDTLYFEGAARGAIQASRQGADLLLWIVGTSDSVLLVNWLNQSTGVSHLVLDDGAVLDRPAIMALLNRPATPPTAAADSITISEDGGAIQVAASQLLANDTDPDAGAVLSVVSVGASALGAAVLLDGGVVRYDTGGRFQELADGQLLKDWFTYTITDETGKTASAVVNVSIVGVNDAPVAASDAGSVTDQTAATASGNVLANDSDVDAGTVLKVAAPGTYAGAYGTLTMEQDGSYTYTLNNSDAKVAALGQGESAVDSFAYVVTDGLASVASKLDISITGANDAPVLASDAGQVAEDGQLSASGNLLANDSDGDAGTVLRVAAPGNYVGSYGTLAVAQDGSYSYSLDNAASSVQALAQGQTVVDSFNYAATDGIANVASKLDITIAGANDAPVLGADAVSIDAGAVTDQTAATASGNVLANDSDRDAGTVLKVAAPGTYAGAYGTLTMEQDGSYTYTLNNSDAKVAALGQGESAVDSFAYVVTDGLASVASKLDISITGANDAPVLASDAGQVAEDGQLSASGNLLANDHDVDAGTVLRVAAPGNYVGSYGTLAVAQDGSYSYKLDNAASSVQALSQGQTVVDSFNYAATDGIANVASKLDITIAGANDAPVLVADAVSITEDQASVRGNVLKNDSDVDAGTALQAASAALGGSYGALTLAPDGSYVYQLDTAKAQALGRGASVTEHGTYTATDGIVSGAADLDVTVTGTNDAPVVARALADTDIKFNKSFSFTLLAGSFADVDKGDVLTYNATLADGSELPAWLRFDASTGTFSGVAPKDAASWEVRVTATDKVEATGSTAGSLSASDVFRLTVVHGNQGGGNGQNATPAGQNTYLDDGTGPMGGGGYDWSSLAGFGHSVAAPGDVAPLTLVGGAAYHHTFADLWFA